MAVDLFAGIPVSDYRAALAWYERLLGSPPTFVASETEAVGGERGPRQAGMGRHRRALVVGRHLYDITNAWAGRHPLGVTTVVLTHNPPPDRPNFVFVTAGIEAAVAEAQQIAGDKNVIVNGCQIARQCLEAGLLDEISIELVPVVLGAGTPLFADLATVPAQFDGPTTIVEGTGVTHLRYRVKR